MSDVETTEHAYEAARAVHALYGAHKQLCAQYELGGIEPVKASREALADIVDAIMPSDEQPEGDRADSVIDALLSLLAEMRIQSELPHSQRGCAWPVTPEVVQ